MSDPNQAGPSLGSRLIGALGIVFTHLLAFFFVLIVLTKMAPTYAIFFESQDLVLPEATRRVIVWSEFWVAFWFIILFFWMAIDAGLVFLLTLIGGKRGRLVSVYSHLVLLASLTLVIYVCSWLSHPIYALARDVAE